VVGFKELPLDREKGGDLSGVSKSSLTVYINERRTGVYGKQQEVEEGLGALMIEKTRFGCVLLPEPSDRAG